MTEHSELTGQTIQGYHIQKPIGQGKFSIVYRAETTTGTIVALKKIKVFFFILPFHLFFCFSLFEPFFKDIFS